MPCQLRFATTGSLHPTTHSIASSPAAIKFEIFRSFYEVESQDMPARSGWELGVETVGLCVASVTRTLPEMSIRNRSHQSALVKVGRLFNIPHHKGCVVEGS